MDPVLWMRIGRKKMDPWYLSKRNYAALILLIVTGARLFDIELDSQFQERLMDFMSSAGVVAAGILAVWSKRNEGKKE
jgi:hypothetical protein